MPAAHGSDATSSTEKASAHLEKAIPAGDSPIWKHITALLTGDVAPRVCGPAISAGLAAGSFGVIAVRAGVAASSAGLVTFLSYLAAAPA